VFALAGAVAGCGSDDADGTQVVTFLRHDNPNYKDADTRFFLEYMAAHPDVKIEDTTVDFRTLSTELNGNLKNDQFKWDFVLVPPERLCSFAENLLEVPADVITVDDAKTRFFAAPLEGSLCNGKLKGVPVEYNLEYGGVVVNLDKYADKFGAKRPGWATWEEFLAEAAALTEYDPAGNPMANGLDIDPGWSPPTRHIFFAQILQRGGTYWSAAGNTWALQSQEAVDSLTAMVEWVNGKKLMFTSLIPDKNTGVITRLASGASGFGWNHHGKPLSVMGYVGTWGVPSAFKQLPQDARWRFEYFPLPPMIGGTHKFVTDSGWAFAVPKTSKHPKLAWDIIRSLALSPEQMKKWSATTGALPALKANATPEAVAGNPALERVLPLLELGRYRGFIPAQAIDMANGAIVRNFFAVVKGTKTVPVALKDMEDEANAAITQPR
jgi:multiple sugar transport system substrate-binding protein